MSANERSKLITQGVERTPNRAMLRAVGFGDNDFNKPIIGVANGYSTVTPCNAGLNDLAQRAVSEVRESGAMPQIFGTITVSDGISMGTEGMKFSLSLARSNRRLHRNSLQRRAHGRRNRNRRLR